MNNMNLIMERWRNFSEIQQINNTTVLIETKNIKTNLEQLNLLYENKTISKKQYVDILCESIDNDLNELDVKGSLQRAGSAISGAFESFKNSLKEKILPLFAKIKQLALTAGEKAIPYIDKLNIFILKIATSPTTKKIASSLITVLIILVILGILFGSFKAQAATGSVNFSPGAIKGVSYLLKKLINLKVQLASGTQIDVTQELVDKLTTAMQSGDTTGLSDGARELGRFAQETVSLANLESYGDVAVLKQQLNDAASKITDMSDQIQQAAGSAAGAPVGNITQGQLLKMDVPSIIQLVQDQWPQGTAKSAINLSKLADQLAPSLSQKTGIRPDKLVNILNLVAKKGM